MHFRKGWAGISVGIATRYGLDGQGIESRWGIIFSHSSDRPWGPPSLLYNGYMVFPGGKAAGAWRYHPATSSVEVKERVELYFYPPSGPSWPVLAWTVPVLYFIKVHVFYLLDERNRHRLRAPRRAVRTDTWTHSEAKRHLNVLCRRSWTEWKTTEVKWGLRYPYHKL
jgi:hypothetical protein